MTTDSNALDDRAARWCRAVTSALVEQARFLRLDLDLDGFLRGSTAWSDHDITRCRQLFGESPPLALVRFDTPGIQSYIFQVTRPVDIEGGSRLIEGFVDLDTETSILTQLRPWAIERDHFVYCGGGGGLLVCAASQASAVARQLESWLAERTDGDVEALAATVAIWPWPLLGGAESPTERDPEPLGLSTVLGPLRDLSPYGQVLDALGQQLRARRVEYRCQHRVLTSRQVEQRCEACARRVGTERGTEHGQPVRLCAGCHTRRQHSRGVHDRDAVAESYEAMVDGLGDPGIAVLYADGANIGAAFQRVRSPMQHQVLSQAVDRAMTKARRAALEAARTVAPWIDGPPRRWQAPLSGGDDLLLVLPASVAPDVVVPLATTFESEFARDTELQAVLAHDSALRQRICGFGIGIGFAVADWMFPVQFTLGYARALLRSAKVRIRPGGTRSAVDFMVLRATAPLCEDLATLRRPRRSANPAGKELGSVSETASGAQSIELTRRPFTLAEYSAILERRDALAEVSATQRHVIRRELARGRESSLNVWRYQHARAQSDDAEGWARYRQRLGIGLADIDTDLWGDADDATTDFVDALDLVHLLERRHAIRRRLQSLETAA